MADVGIRLGVEGEKDFKQALSDINKDFKVLGSEMKLVASQFEKNDNSIGALSSRNEVLNKQIDAQKNKIETLRAALNNASESFGENDKRTKNWQIQLNNAEAALNGMEREFKANAEQIDKANSEYSETESSLKDLKNEVEKTASSIKNADTEFSNIKKSLDNTEKEMGDVAESADDMGKEIDKSGKSAIRSSEKFSGFKTVLNGVEKAAHAVGTAAKTIGTSVVAVGAAAGGASVKLGKEVITAFSDYEQLAGGIQTLFSSASREVEANANKAYLSAGLSANEYMETVTSFSASLIQSLGGDTKKAAEMADMAIIDMSDNANKMGTDMASIQNAYQGFAKQNYSMLDNLKLGYGGTQKEMYRLLTDAAKIDKSFATTAKFSMDTKGQLTADYADIVQAIHIVQDEMGISGTTAEEAQNTISGSINSTKAAFKNLIAGLGDGSANIGQRVNALALSIKDVLTNVEPVIKNLVAAIPTAAKTLFGSISKLLLPTVLEAVTSIASALLEEAPALLESLSTSIIDLLPGALDFALNDVLPNLVSLILSIAGQLLASLSEALPDLMISLSGTLSDTLNFILNEALPNLVSSVLSITGQLLTSLSEALPDLMISLAESFSAIVTDLFSEENITGFVQLLLDFIKNALAGIGEALPIILEAIKNVALNLIDALPEIFSMILGTIPDLIDNISLIIKNGLPVLVQGAIELISSICQNLPLILEQLFENLPRILESISSALTDNLPILIQCGIDLAKGLVVNLPKITLGLLKAAPGILLSIAKALLSGLSSIVEVGKNIVKGLWEGITGAASWLWEKITGWMKGIWDGIKNFFGIHSPSTKMRDMIGKNLVKGLAEGITDEGKTAVNAMTALSKNLSAVTFSPISFIGITDDLSNAIPADFDRQMRTSVLTGSQYDGGASARPTSQVFNTPVHVTFGNVTINDGSDVEDIAHRVSDIIANDVMVKGGAFA